MRYSPAFLLLFLGFLLSGCVAMNDPETSQEYREDVVGVVSPQEHIGQTIVSRRAGLNSLTLWLTSTEPDILVTLKLYYSPEDENPIFGTQFPLQDGKNRIDMPTQLDPPGQGYYFELSTTQGIVNVLGRDEDCYALGNAFSDGSILESDLAFSTTYAYGVNSIFEDLVSILSNWRLLIPLTILLFIPGWLVLEFSGLYKGFDAGERVGVSVGMSLAIIPVLMLWTTLFGFHWDREIVLAGAGFVTALFLLRLAARLLPNPSILDFSNLLSRLRSPFTILWAIFGVSLFVRVAMIRDVNLPMWVDSIHHSLIAKAIVEVGGYPDNYLPFIPIEARFYHPGYHSIVATFHWLSGLEIQKAMLILGQVLNALMIFPVYVLTNKLVKDKTAGIVAAFIIGLITVMPAYYTSWGRYTQLAGLLVLPTTIVWSPLKHKGKTWVPSLVLGAISVGGLGLIHYRVLVFMGFLAAATWIGHLYGFNKNTRKSILSDMKQTASIGICGLLLVLPWLLPTLTDLIIPRLNTGGSMKTSLQAIHTRYHTAALGVPALILSGMGLIWGLYKRRRFTIIILIWVAFMFAVANPAYFRIPLLSGLVNQVSVEITLFIPIAILGGYATSQLLTNLEKRIPTHWLKAWYGLFLITGLCLAFRGVQKLLPSLNPDTILFRNNDQAGINWISENIPEGETIVINPKGWGYGLYMGADGGYWITPLADRPTMPPNVLYGMNRKAWGVTNSFVETLLSIVDDPEKIQELLLNYGYRYIYIGSKGGVISSKALDESPEFVAIFHEMDTWIFKMVADQ